MLSDEEDGDVFYKLEGNDCPNVEDVMKDKQDLWIRRKKDVEDRMQTIQVSLVVWWFGGLVAGGGA